MSDKMQLVQATGSITQRAALMGRTLADIMSAADTIVMLDISSSMATQDSRGRRARIDAATEDLAKLQEKFPGRVMLVQFNDSAEIVPTGVPGEPQGTTDVASALELVKDFDFDGMKFILISDGEPNSANGALAVAKTFRQPIYTIYVGPEGGEGRAFLEALSSATGGTSMLAARADNLLGVATTLLLEQKQ